jgi:hypothetical protein
MKPSRGTDAARQHPIRRRQPRVAELAGLAAGGVLRVWRSLVARCHTNGAAANAPRLGSVASCVPVGVYLSPRNSSAAGLRTGFVPHRLPAAAAHRSVSPSVAPARTCGV